MPRHVVGPVSSLGPVEAGPWAVAVTPWLARGLLLRGEVGVWLTWLGHWGWPPCGPSDGRVRGYRWLLPRGRGRPMRLSSVRVPRRLLLGPMVLGVVVVVPRRVSGFIDLVGILLVLLYYLGVVDLLHFAPLLATLGPLLSATPNQPSHLRLRRFLGAHAVAAPATPTGPLVGHLRRLCTPPRWR